MDNTSRVKDDFPKDLDAWAERIREKELPVFNQTVGRILGLAQDDVSSAASLAQVVLQDAHMTSRVLRLVNSPLYHHCRVVKGASTVSRAIVVLGFNAIRNICLTVTLVDELVREPARKRLFQALAQAIHAAVHARGLALDRNDPSPEEVFIATLLHRVGELAFWAFGGEQCLLLEQALKRPGVDPGQAEEDVLGFRLQRLSRKLVDTWRLSDLLREAINRPRSADTRIQLVTLGDDIAHAIKTQGWESEPVREWIEQATKFTKRNRDDLKQVLISRAREARQVAADLGAPEAAAQISLPVGVAASAANGNRLRGAGVADDIGTEHTDLSPFPEPNPVLQLNILRELGLFLEEERRVDFNLIMEMVLEGLYRGVGVDRALFALLTPDKRGLRARFAVGHHPQELLQGFQFRRSPENPHPFFKLIESKKPRLFARDSAQTGGNEGLGLGLTESASMVAPIVVNGQGIGLFYADRSPSERPLGEVDFNSFKYFVLQANLCLTITAAHQNG